jgi:hypothetical protein
MYFRKYHVTHIFCKKKFIQSQNVTRKKAFVQKRHTKNVDEIDSIFGSIWTQVWSKQLKICPGSHFCNNNRVELTQSNQT